MVSHDAEFPHIDPEQNDFAELASTTPALSIRDILRFYKGYSSRNRLAPINGSETEVYSPLEPSHIIPISSPEIEAYLNDPDSQKQLMEQLDPDEVRTIMVESEFYPPGIARDAFFMGWAISKVTSAKSQEIADPVVTDLRDRIERLGISEELPPDYPHAS